jgi:uncharacterized protein (TIGR02145 family)
MKKLFKFSLLSLLVILLTFFQVSAEEESIDMLLSVTGGNLIMYFVDGEDSYLDTSEVEISFGETSYSFNPVDVEGIFGTSEQKLRIENGTPGQVELSVGLSVTDFDTDAKWDDGEGNTFLAYSTDGTSGGLLLNSENLILNDNDCGEVTSDMESARFTYLGLEDPGNVMSIDVLNTTGGDFCIFDLTNLKLIQTIPPRTSSGNYSLGMVLTLTSGDWWVPEYTLSYTAGEGGSISGESTQTVPHGSDGSSVESVPNQGYEFVDWSDGVMSNPRADINVTGDISVTANFTFLCGSTFIDTRDDNKEYSTVEIGDQCWMAENLDYDDGCGSVTWENGVDEGWCGYHENDTGQTHGLLYQWSAAMGDDSVEDGDTTTSVQGICPEGWLLPSDIEWHTLESHLSTGTCTYPRNTWSCSPAGDQLKSTSPNWCDGSPCGGSGFNALAGGRRNANGSFDYWGLNADFWSSSLSGVNAWRRRLYYTYSSISRGAGPQDFGFFVRCLKD